MKRMSFNFEISKSLIIGNNENFIIMLNVLFLYQKFTIMNRTYERKMWVENAIYQKKKLKYLLRYSKIILLDTCLIQFIHLLIPKFYISFFVNFGFNFRYGYSVFLIKIHLLVLQTFILL